MNDNRNAGYYRRREQIELERAERARHSSARRAHLGLAALYRREYELASAEVQMLDKGGPSVKEEIRLTPSRN